MGELALSGAGEVCVKRAEIVALVRREVAAALGLKTRRVRPCGRGSSEPRCWGSCIYGPSGCYCRDVEYVGKVKR